MMGKGKYYVPTDDISEYRGLNTKEREYLNKFYREHYHAAFYDGGENLIKSDNAKREAHKNKNSKVRDAALNGARSKKMEEYVDNETREFMEDMSDSIIWEDIYDMDGYEGAVNYTIIDTINKIKDTTEGIYVMEILQNFHSIMLRIEARMKTEKKLDKELEERK